MENTNSMIVTGNLCRDCDVMYTKSGHMVCKFTIAHNRYKKVGEKWEKTKTIFLDCEMWNEIAQQNENKLLKGKQVMVEGRYDVDSWVGKENQNQKRSKLVVNKIVINEGGK
jgi:single-strand DNA-binding protein